MNTKIKILDIIIIFLLGLISITFLLLWTINKSNGKYVIISTPSGQYEYPLNVNKKIKIKGALFENIIEIKNNSVRFLKSNCRHRTCLRFGFIKNNGAIAACLPNRISIFIKSNNSVDTVSR